MAEHGGYRRPSSPAPISGPGALSQRTDGGPSQPARYMSGGDYGDGQELMGLQQSAPLAASSAPQTQGQRVSASPQGAALPTPFSAPTERPEELITEGNRLGPGGGLNVLSAPTPQPYLSQVLGRMAQADPTGDAARMLSLAQRLGY